MRKEKTCIEIKKVLEVKDFLWCTLRNDIIEGFNNQLISLLKYLGLYCLGR